MEADTEKQFLHALILAAEADYSVMQKVASGFESYEVVWHAGAAELGMAGLDAERVLEITQRRGNTQPDMAWEALTKQGIRLITPEDADFPKELLSIASPPQWLYIKGRLDPALPRLAIVGTRKATAYGREATEKLVRELAQATELTIVSGLAQGIDAEAHRAALSAGFPTIGVLAGGMDRNSFYPFQNWNLTEEMVTKGGAIISEYPPGTPSLPHHFIIRNRLIAGLSLGTVVVEAPEHSGALTTAGFALEQGREVFALPGSIFSLNSYGTHRLIQDGAKLVMNGDDIINELNLPRRSLKIGGVPIGLTDETEKLIVALLHEARSIDELKSETKLETPAILASLSSLELKGFVRPMGQNRFQRIA